MYLTHSCVLLSRQPVTASHPLPVTTSSRQARVAVRVTQGQGGGRPVTAYRVATAAAAWRGAGRRLTCQTGVLAAAGPVGSGPAH